MNTIELQWVGMCGKEKGSWSRGHHVSERALRQGGELWTFIRGLTYTPPSIHTHTHTHTRTHAHTHTLAHARAHTHTLSHARTVQEVSSLQCSVRWITFMYFLPPPFLNYCPLHRADVFLVPTLYQVLQLIMISRAILNKKNSKLNCKNLYEVG